MLNLRLKISDFIRKHAIKKPINVKVIVIIINGIIILISIDGEDNLLMLAGWWRVFHQSTENFIIGILIEPKIINTAVIFSPTLTFEKDSLIKIINK